jgi:hypothetical protein
MRGFASPNEDLIELRLLVRDFLARESSEPAVRRLLESAEGYEPSTWRRMADELALQGLATRRKDP